MDTPQEKLAGDPALRGGARNTPQAELSPHVDEFRELPPGKLIDGRYKVNKLVGHGGVGQVYLVEHVFLKKRFALKTLNHAVASHRTIRRFQQEAQAARSLDHPNLVRAVDFGLIDEGFPYFVMDFVEGESLAQYLKRHGTLSVEEVVEIFVPICSGLGYAHEHGIIHRDIKPGNIVLVANDRKNGWIPKIVDFGIARLTSGDLAESLTKTGDVFGTPLYMSPEQCAGTRVDESSDIYSLGCVLYEMLTGAPPFRGDSALAIMMQHGSGKVTSLKEASLGRQFPPGLEAVVSKTLSKEPSDRYQSCAELAYDLEHLHKKSTLIAKTAALEKENKFVILAGFLALAVIGMVASVVLLPRLENHKKTVAPTSLPATSAQPPRDDIALLDLARTDKQFFYRVSETKDTRTFIFPERPVDDQFLYPGKSRLKVVKIQGRVEVSKNTKLILQCRQIILNPARLAPFQSGDLWGAVVDCGENGDKLDFETPADQVALAQSVVAHLRPLELNFLSLKLSQYPRSTVRIIGQMPGLHWLNVESSDPGKTPVDGAELAKLENLKQLNILSCGHVGNVTALLTALAQPDSSIRRLTLRSCKLSNTDLKLISSIKSLLYVTFDDVSADWNSEPTIAALNLVAEKKNLKGITLSSDMGANTKLWKAISPNFLANPSLQCVSFEKQRPGTVGDFYNAFVVSKRKKLAVVIPGVNDWDSGSDQQWFDVDPL